MFDPSAHRFLWIFPTFFVSCVSHVFAVSVASVALSGLTHASSLSVGALQARQPLARELSRCRCRFCCCRCCILTAIRHTTHAPTTRREAARHTGGNEPG